HQRLCFHSSFRNRELSKFNTFFPGAAHPGKCWSSTFMVSLPTMRSNSAIRTSFACTSCGCSNTWVALLKNSCFHLDRIVSLISYSRLASARLFLPVSNSSTTLVLNSASKFRRFLAILDLFPGSQFYP